MMLQRLFHLFVLYFSFVHGEDPVRTTTVGSYKYVLYNQGKLPAEAISACIAKDAWLVEIKYEEMNQAVASIITHDVLIGAKYENGWKWNDGSSMRYTNWASNQPLSDTEKNDCFIMSYQTHNWKNFDCDPAEGRKPRHYVCQSDISYSSCHDEVCSNRGKCITTGKRYKCSCEDGYFGTKCEKKIIEISSDQSTYNVKKGQVREITFTIVSYDGNVDVKKEDGVLASTKSITRSQVTEDVEITFGPFVSNDDLIIYMIEAVSNTTNTKSRGITINIKVEDHCKSNPCKNGADCNYILSSPYFKCVCKPAFSGSTCNELIYRHVNNCKYHVNHDSRKIFSDALRICQGIAGSLAMMKSSEIQDAVEDQVIKQYRTGNTIAFWIGGTNLTKPWHWLDNTTIPLTGRRAKWASTNEHSPKSATPIRDFLILSSYGDMTRRNMKWYSKPSKDRYGYVCEVPKNNPCESLQCKNQGTCIAVGCQANCNCTLGYTGTNCKIEVFTISAMTRNFTSMLDQNITVTLRISGYNGSVKVDVLEKSINSEAIYTKHNIRHAVNITIGPFVKQSIGTKYLFRATLDSNPGSFYKYTSIYVVVQGMKVFQLHNFIN